MWVSQHLNDMGAGQWKKTTWTDKKTGRRFSPGDPYPGGAGGAPSKAATGKPKKRPQNQKIADLQGDDQSRRRRMTQGGDTGRTTLG